MRSRAGLLLVLLAVLVSACTLDVDVHVDVHPDGGGTVEVTAAVDAGALQRIGGDLGAALDLDRLRADGWSIDGPTPTDAGGSSVHLQQSFADPAGADRILAKLAGEGDTGPLRDLHVTKGSTALQDRWGFRGVVDLGDDVAVPGVQPSADGSPLPTDLAQLEQQLGQSLDRLLRVRIGVRLPGDVDSNATTKADNGAVWQVRFGDGRAELEATGTQARTSTYLLVGVVVLLVVVVLVTLLVRLAGRSAAPERRAVGR